MFLDLGLADLVVPPEASHFHQSFGGVFRRTSGPNGAMSLSDRTCSKLPFDIMLAPHKEMLSQGRVECMLLNGDSTLSTFYQALL